MSFCSNLYKIDFEKAMRMATFFKKFVEDFLKGTLEGFHTGMYTAILEVIHVRLL